MIIKLKYRYYIKRHMDSGTKKTRYRKEDYREGTFDFDTDQYRDDENNHWNVVSDHLNDSGIPEPFSLNVSRAIEHMKTDYFDDDVVLTTDDEFFFYWEVKKYKLTVKEKATKKEAAEYIKEFAYHQKEEQDNIAAANYGSSYGD